MNVPEVQSCFGCKQPEELADGARCLRGVVLTAINATVARKRRAEFDADLSEVLGGDESAGNHTFDVLHATHVKDLAHEVHAKVSSAFAASAYTECDPENKCGRLEVVAQAGRAVCRMIGDVVGPSQGQNRA